MVDDKLVIGFNSDRETQNFLKEMAEKNGLDSVSDLLRSMVVDLKNMSSKHIPDWLYSGEVSKAELHRFAIALDKSELDKEWKSRMVKTIYAGFATHKDFIESFTNPENIFHVPIFQETLGNLEEYAVMYKEWDKARKIVHDLMKEKSDLEDGMRKLEIEYNENERKSEELKRFIDRETKKSDELEKYNANLRSNDGVKKITEYLEAVKGLVSTIEKTDKEKSSTGDLLYSERDRYLSAKQYQQLLELTKMANELENVLKSEDFISAENLDKKRQELKKQMEEVAKSNQVYAQNHLPSIDNKAKEILESLYQDLEILIPGQMQRGGAQSKIAEAISLLDLSKNRKNNLFRLKKGDPE